MCAAPEGPSRQILRAFPGVNMVQPYKNLQAYIGNALSCLYSKCIPTVEPLAVATHKLIGFRSWTSSILVDLLMVGYGLNQETQMAPDCAHWLTLLEDHSSNWPQNRGLTCRMNLIVIKHQRRSRHACRSDILKHCFLVRECMFNSRLLAVAAPVLQKPVWGDFNQRIFRMRSEELKSTRYIQPCSWGFHWKKWKTGMGMFDYFCIMTARND